MKNRNLWASFIAALNGVRQAWIEGTNVRLMVLLAYGILLLAAWLGIRAIEAAILMLAISSVFVAEMINTSIETVVDMVTKDYHPLARKAKDIAAGGVLAASVISIGIGVAIFLPYMDRIPGAIIQRFTRPDALTVLELGVAATLALAWIASLMSRASWVRVKTGAGEGRRGY